MLENEITRSTASTGAPSTEAPKNDGELLRAGADYYITHLRDQRERAEYVMAMAEREVLKGEALRDDDEFSRH